ncbi:MAG: TOBE domain-containing protein [Burkholderiales bacterium]|nr:TOBE domain-containing protein [Burkholderiales bacterium]MDE2395645.1 TOBE domain-containing protein [Burkholderiales bacterium]MDE2456661.1 TOBE domain-containing protein [Burkholderiales bacterium]
MATDPRLPTRSALLTGRIAFETPLGAVLSESRVRLLEAIDRRGSLTRAAREVPLSYKAAWDALDAMTRHSPEPLVLRATGGAGGGGSRLTDYARQLVALYRAMESSQQDVLDRLPAWPELGAEPDAPALRSLIRRMTMRSSARNQFACEVAALDDHGGRVDVGLDLLDGQGTAAGRIVATVTPESAQAMALAPGSALYALVKAPWVDVHARPPRAALGRNLLAGRVAELRPGRSHWGVGLTLASGLRLEASIGAARARVLEPGQEAWGSFAKDGVVLVSFA